MGRVPNRRYCANVTHRCGHVVCLESMGFIATHTLTVEASKNCHNCISKEKP
jgi:hypothetical protein